MFSLANTLIVMSLSSSKEILYFQKWKIKINEQKTQAIFFTKRRSIPYIPTSDLSINGCKVKWTKQLKYLGFTFDKSLIYKDHITQTINRVNSLIKVLYPLINRKSQLSIENKLLIFKMIFQPVMSYAAPIFATGAKSHTTKLQIAQNKVLKIILNRWKFFSTKALHSLAKVGLIDSVISVLNNKFYDGIALVDNPLINSLT